MKGSQTVVRFINFKYLYSYPFYNIKYLILDYKICIHINLYFMCTKENINHIHKYDFMKHYLHYFII